MLYELRSYWIEPALLEQYLAWARDKAQPLQREKYGFRVIGFWQVGDAEGTVTPDDPNVVWMCAWNDRAERDRVWNEIRSSADWAAIREGIPNFHRRPGNVKFLTALSWSPLQ
ncbi:MAG TPA: NIPSNAP family protein [Chloroflexota bacterium]|nr:NIPSNAP family protein [Chloroflexota bacterium]